MKSLRVAVVYDCLYPIDTGGGERVYRALAEILVARGATVDYVTRAPRTRPEPTPFRIVPLWAGEIYDDAGTRTLAGALRFAGAVARHFRANRGSYDVVIASALPATTLLAVAAALLGSRTAVVGDWMEVWPAAKWRRYAGAVSGTIAWVLQAVAARSAAVNTANSEFTAGRLRRIARHEVVVLDLLGLGGAARRPLKADEPRRLLVVGRLIPDKRVDALPAALARVRDRYPGTVVDVVGTGPEAPRITEAARRAGVEGGIVLHGRLDDDELEGVRRSAAVHVLASAREGFGLVVAEAASRGIPSVVVDGPDNAAAELVEEGISGYHASTVSPDDLGGAIVRALDDGDRLRSSTAAWYRRRTEHGGLAAGLDEVLGLLGMPESRIG